MDSEHIAAIARGLSKAQRGAITSARPTFDGPNYIPGFPGVTRKALREKGLAHGDLCYLTPTGYAVHQHLLAAAGDA